MAENKPKGAAAPAPNEPAGDPQQQVALRMDERDLSTGYANAFRTNATPEELVVDFGYNAVGPAPDGGQPQITFKLSNRVIMNYYTAKRLALSLGQVIRQYEDAYGEIELNADERRKKK